MERCYLRALKLLSRAEHSRKGLELKLTQRGFQMEEICKVLDRLEEEGALDDRRFGKEWIRSRLRKHSEGRSLLELELQKRGLDEVLSREVVKECVSWPEYREALRRLYVDLCSKGIQEPREIASRLRKKGYSSYEIRLLFEELG
ncbi:MAG: recombination regulator RecX [Spirochaetes bacterium]|nr:recombination regulator RecX [Spirochaetota bacterium]